MAYSLTEMPNRRSVFPPPPEWLVWVGDSWVDASLGQVRHLPTLKKCKERVRNYTVYAGETFERDWAVYQWDRETLDYKLAYSGKVGDAKADSPLFQKRFKKGEGDQVRDVPDDEIEAALKSILEAAS